MKSNLAFGAVLRLRRIRLGLSQNELASGAGLDRTYISLLELGRSSPTLETMYSLCGALNVQFQDLAQLIDDTLAKVEDDSTVG